MHYHIRIFTKRRNNQLDSVQVCIEILANYQAYGVKFSLHEYSRNSNVVAICPVYDINEERKDRRFFTDSDLKLQFTSQ